MMNKFLEKKVSLLTKDDEIELEKPIHLEYFLLESVEQQNGEMSGKTVYGIEVVKDDGQGYYESEMVRNIYCCRESTKKLLKKLAENTVTPLSLYYVLEDIVGV